MRGLVLRAVDVALTAGFVVVTVGFAALAGLASFGNALDTPVYGPEPAAFRLQRAIRRALRVSH